MTCAPSVRETLTRSGVLAILRYRDGGDVPAAVEALIAGGVRVLEVTLDTPGAWDVISTYADRDGLVVGGGTVTTTEEVLRLARLGGRFAVSPGFDPDVVATALEAGLTPLPGVATGTEVLAARRSGVELFKLFPAGGLGLAYFEQLRGPFAREAFIPTGGIGVENVPTWLAAGACAVALGSDLAGRAAPVSTAESDALTERAARALALARRGSSVG